MATPKGDKADKGDLPPPAASIISGGSAGAVAIRSQTSQQGSVGSNAPRARRRSRYDAPSFYKRRKSSDFGVRNRFGSGVFTGNLLDLARMTQKEEEEAEALRIASLAAPGIEITAPTPKISLVGCCIVILACVLGCGIFAAPEGVLGLIGNGGTTLLIWVAAGLIAMNGALSFIELGCTFPISGGNYAYLTECLGPFFGFLFQISHNVIVCPVVAAIMAAVFAKNVVTPYISICREADWTVAVPTEFRTIEGIDETNGVWAHRCAAILIIWSLGYLNCKSPLIVAKCQGVFIVVNVLAILYLTTCGWVTLAIRGGFPKGTDMSPKLLTADPADGHEYGGFEYVLIFATSLFQASFSYLGYTCANYIMEELENPVRTMTLGVFISLPIIAGVNVFANFCYMAGISVQAMRQPKPIAQLLTEATFSSSVIPYVMWIGPSLVAVSAAGGLTSFLLVCSRISYTGARNGDFPPMFKLVDRNFGTPRPSVIWICVLASLYSLLDLGKLILVASYLESLVNCACIFGLIYLRFKKPELPRPRKFPLVLHINFVAISTFLFLIPIVSTNGSNYTKTIWLLGGIALIFLLGTPLYFIFIKTKRDWPWLLSLNGGLVTFWQKLLLVIPEEDEDEDEFDNIDNINEYDEILLNKN